ncbi:MAG TPA: acetate kinase [Dissulfurispiraceae bacterium]|nr:acetate kinase [Dissulfurispiraceae bacterium]
MKVLVLNSGSSSIKYQLFNMEDKTVLTSGIVEQIGEPAGRLRYKWLDEQGETQEGIGEGVFADHSDGLKIVFDVTAKLGIIRDMKELYGIGHRVLHGGEAFWKPTLITGRVVEVIREMIPLGPLHNPPNLMGIEFMLKMTPDIPQVAVFDTAFGMTMPSYAYHYALPYALYKEHHIRRYGFHGTSHRYVSRMGAKFLGKPLDSTSMITIHLGNGSSISAIRNGECVDTSMGMTPLEGLVMGTRCGDIDPAIVPFLGKTLRMTHDQLDTLMNKQSGLKGICGTNDMREVQRLAASGNLNAHLAIDMFCYRIKKYIGSYFAALGKVDAIIFTGGIGENSESIRRQCCSGLENLGITLEADKNESGSRVTREVSAVSSRIRVLVIPTNEELEIAQQTVECIRAFEHK